MDCDEQIEEHSPPGTRITYYGEGDESPHADLPGNMVIVLNVRSATLAVTMQCPRNVHRALFTSRLRFELIAGCTPQPIPPARQ